MPSHQHLLPVLHVFHDMVPRRVFEDVMTEREGPQGLQGSTLLSVLCVVCPLFC